MTRFGILGPVEVEHDGRLLDLGGASQRALLALLLLHANEVVSSDRLVDELWGSDVPASGVAALQVRVSQLRKALGGAASRLETRLPGYLLRVEPGELDLDQFTFLLAQSEGAEPAAVADALGAALALWRGPALDDLAYESFAQAAIQRMDELRLTALELRIDADLALGRHAALVGELRGLVGEHPLRERFRAQLMLALYRSGRQAEALDAYQATRRVLVEELGLEPSPALQDLERSILRQDPALAASRLAAPERSILVAGLGAGAIERLVEVAQPLALRPPKELILVRPVERPAELPVEAAAVQEQRARIEARGIPARAAAFVSRAPGDDLVRMAGEQEVDLVLVDGPPALLDDRDLACLLAGAPCDVAVVLGAAVRPGSILVPFVGAEHDWSAVELGAWLALALPAPLVLAGPEEVGGRRDASRLLASASLAVQRTLGVAAEPLLLAPGPDGLIEAAVGAAYVVVGLGDRWRQQGLGEARRALALAATSPVILVRRGLRPGGLAPTVGLSRFTWSLRG